MTGKVIAGSVSASHNLDPALRGEKQTCHTLTSSISKCLRQIREQENFYIGSLGLSVPAVTCVVGHFILHVLAEAHFILGQAHFNEVEVDSPNKVAQHRVVDHTLEMINSQTLCFLLS